MIILDHLFLVISEKVIIVFISSSWGSKLFSTIKTVTGKLVFICVQHHIILYFNYIITIIKYDAKDIVGSRVINKLVSFKYVYKRKKQPYNYINYMCFIHQWMYKYLGLFDFKQQVQMTWQQVLPVSWLSFKDILCVRKLCVTLNIIKK